MTSILAVDGDGLQLVDTVAGRTKPMRFGAPEPRVLAALARSRQALRAGDAEVRTCAEPGVRARTWPGGFTAVFRGGALVGWELGAGSDGSIATHIGVGVGSTREGLEWSHPPVRREVGGDAFTAGALRGTFAGEGKAARVRSLWAGETCEPRPAPGTLEPVAPESHGVLFEGIPPFEDLVADRKGDWFVVLGSFPAPPGGVRGIPGPGRRTSTLTRATDPRAAALQQRLWNEGVAPWAVWSDVLPKFASGMVVVVVGPYARPIAEERLRALRPVVPDAYLKAGW